MPASTNDNSIVDRFALLLPIALDGERCELGFDFQTHPRGLQPERLLILRCDSDDLKLTSVMRNCWVVDQAGIRSPGKRPLPENFGMEFFLRNPKIKYSTNQERIRYGLTLGPGWYGIRECTLETFMTGGSDIQTNFQSTGHAT